MAKKAKNKVIIILVVIILLQLIYKIYNGTQKQDFFVDELYSYGLMNYKQAFIFNEPTFINNWHNKEYFDDYLIVSEEEATNLAPVYNNQKEDFHPPFYYLLLRIASSFTIGTFTKWTGLILNLIIFICCAIVLYLIGKQLFKSKKYALLLVGIYGFSKFSLENTLFIRMYQLLELQALLLAHWGLRNYYKKKLEIKEILKFIILVVLGTLTHYYYSIFLIGVSIVVIIKYIRKKRFKNLIKFITAFIIAQILISLIFPKYTEQLSSNADRSSSGEIQLKYKIEKYANREKEYLEVLDNNMFNLKVSYIFIGIIAMSIIILLINLVKNRNKKVQLKINRKINIIIVPTIFYWLVISLTSPYIDVRYILPLFVFILISIIYILKKELQILIKNKKAVLILLLIISICYLNPLWGNKEVKYQYTSSKEKFENIEKYKNIPCIYMYTPATVLNNGFTSDFNYVRQFENVYIMDATEFSIEKLEKALDGIDTSKGIIIIDQDRTAYKETKKIVEDIEQFENFEKVEKITIEKNFPKEIYRIN